MRVSANKAGLRGSTKQSLAKLCAFLEKIRGKMRYN